MPSNQQEKNFASEIESDVHVENTIMVQSSALDTAVSWISRNLDPEDVFSVKDLETWAENNGYTKE